MVQLYPANVLEQARATLDGWKKLETPPDFIEGLSFEEMLEEFQRAESLIDQIGSLGHVLQLSDLYYQCDEMLCELWAKTRRVRATIRQRYGEDSPEYLLVSGSRLRNKVQL